MDQDKKDLIRKSAGENMLRSLLIQEKLGVYLDMHPIDTSPALNPQLEIERICWEVSDQVVAEGCMCCNWDVMQIWLTMAVFHGFYLPKLNPLTPAEKAILDEAALKETPVWEEYKS